MSKFTYKGDGDVLRRVLEESGVAATFEHEIRRFPIYQRLTLLLSQAGGAETDEARESILREAVKQFRAIECAAKVAESLLDDIPGIGFSRDDVEEPTEPTEPADHGGGQRAARHHGHRRGLPQRGSANA